MQLTINNWHLAFYNLQVSFICVSPVYSLKNILHIKLTYTYTTAILKELRETIRVTNFKYIQFIDITVLHDGPAFHSKYCCQKSFSRSVFR